MNNNLLIQIKKVVKASFHSNSQSHHLIIRRYMSLTNEDLISPSFQDALGSDLMLLSQQVEDQKMEPIPYFLITNVPITTGEVPKGKTCRTKATSLNMKSTQMQYGKMFLVKRKKYSLRMNKFQKHPSFIFQFPLIFTFSLQIEIMIANSHLCHHLINFSISPPFPLFQNTPRCVKSTYFISL